MQFTDSVLATLIGIVDRDSNRVRGLVHATSLNHRPKINKILRDWSFKMSNTDSRHSNVYQFQRMTYDIHGMASNVYQFQRSTYDIHGIRIYHMNCLKL